MRSVSISHLKAHLSEFLRRAATGERVVVTDRGRPLAEIGPVPTIDEDERIADLVRRGVLRPPKQPFTAKSLEEFLKMPRGDDPQGTVRQALIEDREEGW